MTSKYANMNQLKTGRWYSFQIKTKEGLHRNFVDLLMEEATTDGIERMFRFYFNDNLFSVNLVDLSATEIDNPFSGKLI